MEAFGKLMASPLLLLSISSSPRVSITGTLKLFSSSLNLEKWSLSRGWIEAERERKREREMTAQGLYYIIYSLQSRFHWLFIYLNRRVGLGYFKFENFLKYHLADYNNASFRIFKFSFF